MAIVINKIIVESQYEDNFSNKFKNSIQDVGKTIDTLGGQLKSLPLPKVLDANVVSGSLLAWEKTAKLIFKIASVVGAILFASHELEKQLKRINTGFDEPLNGDALDAFVHGFQNIRKGTGTSLEDASLNIQQAQRAGFKSARETPRYFRTVGPFVRCRRFRSCGGNRIASNHLEENGYPGAKGGGGNSGPF
ncbi:MAG: hypothetical protein IID18_07980 [Nitrospinae bacterium]|nr:hypothetical protein [Nitrospinota bacterium]